jgi:hypothetical protein
MVSVCENNINYGIRFEILRTVTMNRTVLWNAVLDLLFNLHDEGNAFLQNVEFLAGAHSVISQEMVLFISYECLKTKMTEILGHFCIIFMYVFWTSFITELRM